MSTKVKLISIISAFVLVLGIMIIGVLSAEQVQVNIGGSVSFNATNVYARVSGDISGAGSGNKTFSTLTYSAEETTGNESDWTNLALEFTETPAPIIITITVENLSTQRTLTANLTNTLSASGLNIAVTRDTSSYASGTNVELGTAGSSTDSTTFTLTLTVANLDEDLTDATFGYILNIFDESVEIPISDFIFTTSGDTATLTEYTGAGGDVVIPSTISLSADGTAIVGSDYTVTAIAAGSSSSGPFYSARSTLTSITVPESITSIGNHVFNGCSNLTSVNFGDNSQLTNIGSSAFSGCRSLTSITIGEEVTSIGNHVFYGCRALIEINYNATNAADLASNNYVFDSAGQDGEGITVNIGANVRSLPNYIFYPNSGSSSRPNITTVNFAEDGQLTSIGNYTFYNCSSLTSITIPDSVTSIGSLAFLGCSALAEVYNYSSLTITVGSTSNGYVGWYAKVVYNADDLVGEKPATSITVVDNVQYYNYGSDFIAIAPTSRNVAEVTLDNRTTEINQEAFSHCLSLTSIKIKENVTRIGQSAFSYCFSLTSITFEGNSKLVSIGNYAFRACGDLTSISIPEGVTSIGIYVFDSCSSLTSIEVDSVNANYSSEDGVLFNKDKTTLVAYPAGNTRTSYIIPSSVNSIDDNAFFFCESLTTITIPNSVTSIGRNAFSACNFTSVTIDSSYAYQNAGASSSTCGYLLEDANTVYVNANLVGSYTASSYLTSNFTCSDAPNEAGYYVYTRN